MKHDEAGHAVNSTACDPKIFKHGTCVFVTHTIATEDAEAWVRAVAAHSEQQVDWSYFAGRMAVRALGDLGRVRASILALRPQHDEMMRKALGALRFNEESDARQTQGIWDYNSYRLMGAEEEYGSEMMRMWVKEKEQRNAALDLLAEVWKSVSVFALPNGFSERIQVAIGPSRGGK